MPSKRATKPEIVSVNDRRGYLGGSDAAACLGISQWDTPYSLWARKLGFGVELDPEGNRQLLLGKMLEPVCADLFQLDKKILAVHAPGDQLFRHPTRRWQAAHLDRWLINEETFLECKALSFGGGDWDEEVEGAQGVPDYYVAQLDHCMSVMDVSYCWIAMFSHGRNHASWRVERDEKRERALIAAEEELWEMIQSETPPPFRRASDVLLAAQRFGWSNPKAKKVTRAVTAEEELAWSRLKAANRQFKAAKTKKSEAHEQVMLLSQGQPGKVVAEETGEVLGTIYWQNRESISIKSIRETVPTLLESIEASGFLHQKKIMIARATKSEDDEEDDDA